MGCSREVHQFYNRLRDEIGKKRLPPISLLRSILDHCSVREDVELALEALHGYRIHRCSKGHVKENFKENMSELLVSASLRAGAHDLGLKTLWKHNIYGFSPSLTAAHLLLSHAKQKMNLDVMQKTINTMVKNSLMPTAKTADIVLRLCRDSGDTKLLLSLAKEFQVNGVRLSPALYDICISCAANTGNIEEVWAMQGWRQVAGLDHTFASAFSCAKAFVLKERPLEAAELIFLHCQDTTKLNKYLSMMVRVWPLELSFQCEEGSKEEFLAKLKESLVEMVDILSAKHSDVVVNAVEEFGKGKLRELGQRVFILSNSRGSSTQPRPHCLSRTST